MIERAKSAIFSSISTIAMRDAFELLNTSFLLTFQLGFNVIAKNELNVLLQRQLSTFKLDKRSQPEFVETTHTLILQFFVVVPILSNGECP